MKKNQLQLKNCLIDGHNSTHFTLGKNLKTLLIVAMMLLSVSWVQATTYYLTTAGAGAAETAGSWNTVSDGSGTPATTFTANHIFIIPNGVIATFTSNVAFGSGSGGGADIQVVSGASATINNGVTLTINGKSNDGGTMTVSGTIIFLGTSKVTFSYNNANTTFTLNSGANLKTENPNGILGTNSSITSLSSNVVTLSTAANYEFNGTANQATTGMPATVNNLTISGSGGTTASASFAVNGILTLGANPSTTQGALEMGAYTLTMGATATTVGLGDVTGIVTRTSLTAGSEYAFGSRWTTINFQNTGTLPTAISMKIAIGSETFTGAVLRTYDIIRTGAATGSLGTVTLHYLDGELNGNTENLLVIWDSSPLEAGRSNYNTADNWVAMSSFDMTYLATAYDSKTWYLSESVLPTKIWNGSVSTAWTLPANWTPGVTYPSDLANVVIPDATTTANDPTVDATLAVGTLTISTGGILNSTLGGVITISGTSGAWSNQGTYNADSGEVFFTSPTATISGTTDFYDVTINTGAAVTMGEGGTMRIGGTMTNNGIWRAAQESNTTVEYNGADQTVLNPNGATEGYYHLFLSGSGTKTLPGGTMQVLGNFTNSGTFAHNSGTVTFAGTLGGQTITSGGSSFNNLTITNAAGICSASTSLTAATLTIGPKAKFTYDTGTLTATTFTIQSDATGTGTYLGTGTLSVTTTNVNQYLASARNWYMSTPVSGGTMPRAGYRYNETLSSGNWETVASAASMTYGRGYIVVPTAEATVTFSGALNDGSIGIGLTRTTGAFSPGFNLVGNPYPSHITWTEAIATAANTLTTIWYRTYVSVYAFHTFNANGSIGTPTGTTGLIPPMQAFWVSVNEGGGTLSFANTMRSHSTTANPLKAPAVKTAENQVLRLQVTNGTTFDEAVVYFNANAADGYDAYDSPKMINGATSTVPDIYTQVGTKQLVINGMKAIPYDTEIPLYFAANASVGTSFSITANQFSNFEADTQVWIKNKLSGDQQLISDGSPYTFDLAETGDNPKFSIIIKAPGATTQHANTNNNIFVFANANNQITVSGKDAFSTDATATVYNSLGQRIARKALSGNVTLIDIPMASGVYMVTVINAGNKTTEKIIIS